MHSDRPRALRGTAAALTAAAVGVALALTGSSAARADSGTVSIGATTDFPNGFQRLPVAETLYVAGATGFLHQRAGSSDMLWTRYDAGATVTAFTLPNAEGPLQKRDTDTGWYGAGSDVVALHDYQQPDQVTLYDMANGGASTVVPLNGLTYDGVFGGTVLAVASGTTAHLLTPDGSGGVKDVQVTGLPEGAVAVGALTGDAKSVVLEFRDAAGYHQALLDLGTAVATPVQLVTASRHVTANQVVLSPASIMVDSGLTPAQLQLFSRTDLTAAPTSVPVSVYQGYLRPVGFAEVGGSVLGIQSGVSNALTGSALTATPEAGGGAATLLAGTDDAVLQTPDGGALVAGDTASDADGNGWGFYRIEAGASGPVATKAVPMFHSALPVSAIALERGTVTVENKTKVWSQSVSGGGPLPPALPVDNNASGGPMAATGDGHVVLTSASDSLLKENSGGSAGWLSGGAVTSADGRFVLSGGGALAGDFQYDQWIGSLLAPGAGGPVSGAVWHGYAFVSSGQPGAVTVVDLAAQRVAGVVNSGASCAGADTQVVGRWLYWACGSSDAGVYDLADGARFRLPATGNGYDDALLGNGYLVHHDAVAGQLVLDDIHADAVGATANVVALGGGTAARDRGVTWTVDRYSPELSWFDAANEFHVAPVLGVPATPDWTFSYKVPSVPAWLTSLFFWHGLNPSGANHCTGVRISPYRVLVTADCETGHSSSDFGASASGAGGSNPPYLVDQRYRSATQQDDLSVSRSYDGAGSAAVLAGAADGALYRPGTTAVFYSYAGLGGSHEVLTPHVESVQLQSPAVCAQLLGHALPAGSVCTTPAVGAAFAAPLSQCVGDAGGALVAGGKLIATSATPVGSCAASGVRLYTAIAPRIALVRGWSRDIGPYNSYLSFGGVVADPTKGWISDVCDADMHGCLGDGVGRLVDDSRLFNLILPAGDMNGDGQVDLLLRSKSGGLYWFWGYDRGDGNLDGRKKTLLGYGWNAYTRLFVPGDLTGDGISDLVAVDRAGVMWTYPGKATGGFAGRIRVGGGWNGYNLIGGRGDLTGDGIADLIARDSAGRLWTYVGNGHAAFSARIYDGTGWGQYNAIVPGGDLDGQGRQQLIARLPNGNCYLYTSTTDGRFHPTRAAGGNAWERYAQLT